MSRPYRPRLACQACTRKKIRCDKLIPCGNCVKRGQPDLCVRDASHDERDSAVSLSEPLGLGDGRNYQQEQHQPMEQLVRSLLRRVEQLEAQRLPEQSQQTSLAFPALNPPAFSSPPAQNEESSLPVSPAGSSTSADAVGSLLCGDNAFAQLRTRQLSFLQIILPDRACVEQLVRYHNESLLWSHGGFHAPTFDQELVTFYELHRGQATAAGLDLQWLALLFAVLSASIICASFPVVERWGFRKEDQCPLSERWYDATLECLHMSNYLSEHRLHSLQAIVVLNTSAYMLGRMRSQSVLIGTGIRMAQNLGLDRLGQEADGVSEGTLRRELGRRVWHGLIRQDYFFIPFAENYLVCPMFNRTDRPRNCRDEDLILLPDSVPTGMSYCRLLDRVAALMPELHDSLAARETVYAQYEEIIQFDAKMRALATIHRPAFLSEGPLADPTWPAYVAWAQRSLTISFAHKVIMIHRKMLGRSMTDPVFSFTRKTCVAASKTILKTLRQPYDVNRPVLWIEQAFTVTAGVILCFDILYRSLLGFDPSYTHRPLVQEAITNLHQVEQSIIAQKGVRLLTALLRECSSRLGRNKRRHGEMDGEIPVQDAGAQIVDVETFIRGFWERKNDGVVPVSPATQTPGSRGSLSRMQNSWLEEDMDWPSDYLLYGTSFPIFPTGPVDDLGTGGARQVPSFEDLLFRAENFDF